MMSMSDLLTSAKMDLGIYGIALPFEDPDKSLIDVIRLKTLKIFSIFYPHKMEIVFDINKLHCLKNDYTHSIYEIPDVFGDRTIYSVINVIPNTRLAGGAGYMGPQADFGIDTYDSIMMAQANANLVSTVTPPMTFKFEPPGLLHLYNLSACLGEIEVTFGLEHFDNLASIKPTTWDSFYDLALLDLKRFLYSNLKMYNELQTAFGTVTLRIDEWSNAEGDRKDLLDRWKEVFHLDSEVIYII